MAEINIEELEQLLRRMGNQGPAGEDSIKELIKVMTRLSRTGIGSDDFAESIEDASDGLDVFSSVLNKSQKTTKQKLDELGNAATRVMDNALGGISSFGQGSSESAGVITDAAKFAANAISGVVNAIGSVAGLLGGPITKLIGSFGSAIVSAAAQGAAALIGFYAGQMSSLRESQRSLISSGVQFANGIDGATDIIKDSNITLGDLKATAESAADSLRLMQGGATSGIKRLGDSFRRMGDTNQKYLYALGFTNDEILSGMADYAASAERSGRALSTDELAQGSYAYLKNLRELERLTGVSIKEQAAQQDANRRSLYVQNQLSDLGASERSATEGFLKTIPPMLQDVALSGRGLTTESATLANALPTYAAGIADITAQLKSGALNEVQAKDRYAALMNDPKVAEEIRSNQQIFGQTLASGYGALSGFVEALGALQAQITGNIEAAKQATPNPEDMKGPLQDGINSFVQNTKKLETAAQQIAFGLTELLSPAISKMVGAMSDAALKISDIFTGEGKIAQLTNLQKDIQSSKPRSGRATGSSPPVTSYNLSGGDYDKLTDAELATQGVTRSPGYLYGSNYTFDSKKLPKNALGGLYPANQPFGTPVTVAEAGPEVIAPVKQGPGGAMGIAMPNEYGKQMSGLSINQSKTNELLSLLNAKTDAMLAAMQSNNRLTRQGNMLAG